MKKLLILTLSFIISYGIIAQNQPDSIYAVVDGSYATIYDSGSFRNCGALYDMIITKDGYQLNWLQDDYGMAAYCFCNFDLSVTAGPLDAGHYFVDVYYTEIYNPDTIYCGSTEFTIENPVRTDTLEITDYSQSECYNIVSINENEQDNKVYIYHYPNPVKEYAIFKYYSEEKSKLNIYNLTGKIIRYYDQLKPGTNSIRWLSADESGRDLPDGLYFYVFETRNERITGKIQIVN